MANKLEVAALTAAPGGKPVVADASFRLAPGSIGCLMGPSGCGKTTLLRAIAGFEQPLAGEIRINSVCHSNAATLTPVEQRNVGMVFQDFALFPHLTARGNIAFGLQRWAKSSRTARVEEVLKLLEIGEFQDRHPHQLSGGQQQRVAIGRAIAPCPEILLLDEPFSNMDVELREQLARELRKILKQDGMTALLVTHNLLEAFAMADEIGVIQDGRLLQWGSAFELYHRPVSPAVADFVGAGAFVAGTARDGFAVETELGVIRGDREHGFAAGEPVSVLLRPDDVVHDAASGLTAIVQDKAFRGAQFLYTLSSPSGARLLSLAPSRCDYKPGEAMNIRLDVDHLVAFRGQ